MKPTDRTYTNAAREGRTNPELVEVIEKTDPRHFSQTKSVVANRADYRRQGRHGRPMVPGEDRIRQYTRLRYTQPHYFSTLAINARNALAERAALIVASR